MPKRSNPFGEQSPLQLKTHVGQKEVDLGVAQDELMKSVYEKTRDILFKGSQKAFTKEVVFDANDNMMWQASGEPTSSRSLLPGQMCLDQCGHLTTPAAKSEETEMRMTADEDMAVGMTECGDAGSRLPGQLCLDHNGQLVSSTGVSGDKSAGGAGTPGFSFKKQSTFPSLSLKPKAACVNCRTSAPRGTFAACNFCEQVKCSSCSTRCTQCGGDFCQLCSVLNYDEAVERPFCLNCS
ncbi:apoptosis regulatory protein Siva-like [Haliotis rufescens]|uniref:apoptosis regulatory protein Siva-like n=1 Tax=Haliotis rufescens TaxID=6454 RepID=UPI00201F9363|nr:apoptosis regulatory protein Siva-like [Haliotis rufescens]